VEPFVNSFEETWGICSIGADRAGDQSQVVVLFYQNVGHYDRWVDGDMQVRKSRTGIFHLAESAIAWGQNYDPRSQPGQDFTVQLERLLEDIHNVRTFRLNARIPEDEMAAYAVATFAVFFSLQENEAADECGANCMHVQKIPHAMPRRSKSKQAHKQARLTGRDLRRKSPHIVVSWFSGLERSVKKRCAAGFNVVVLSLLPVGCLEIVIAS
jgi:hypothetical protein